ncbi:hypothetical protein D3C72_849240 [compost metagenome]
MFPVPIDVPPQLPVYHFKLVPDPPVADRMIFPPALEQKLLLFTLAAVGATGCDPTVTVT